MKKYISVFVCITLLITAVIFSPINRGISVGKGNGKNEKLENPKDLQRLLYCISNMNSSYMDNGNDYTFSKLGNFVYTTDAGEQMTLEYPTTIYETTEPPIEHTTRTDETNENEDHENKDYDNSKENTKKYKSVTIHEFASITRSSSNERSENKNYGKYSSESYTKMNRQLSTYMSKGVSYYRSKGQIYTSSSYDAPLTDEDRYSESHINFDIELYINSEDTEVFFKFNSWNMASSEESVIISPEIIGKWITFDSLEAVEDIYEMIDGLNRGAMETIGEVIEEALSNDSFNRNHDKYTINNDILKDILGADELEQGDFTLDMSNPERPTLKMLANASSSEGYVSPDSDSSSYPFYSYPYYSYSSSSSLFMDVNYTFENINNTVINNIEADMEIDEDEIEEYFFINTND